MTDVEGIVASIEHENSALCRRLDLNAFLMIYKILSLAEESVVYQRGIFLLVVGNSSRNISASRLIAIAIIARSLYFVVE